MSFTTPCFIRKNTSDLRKKLEELGYILSTLMHRDILITSPQMAWTISYDIGDSIEDIDCGRNEQLFLAVAALRDDTDRGQWFVLDYDNIWEAVGCYQYKGDFELCDNRDEWYGATEVPTAHKATVEELIEHFKTKEQ